MDEYRKQRFKNMAQVLTMHNQEKVGKKTIVGTCKVREIRRNMKWIG